MTVLTDFVAHLDQVKMDSDELQTYFKAAGFQWLGNGRPNKTLPLPQATVDNTFSTITTNKEGIKEETTAYLSIWYVPGDIKNFIAADEITSTLIGLLHQQMSETGLYMVAMGRQHKDDPDAGMARVQIQFKISPTQ